MKIPKFETKGELHSFLIEHMADLVDAKKNEFKTADACAFMAIPLIEKGVNKATSDTDTVIKRRLIVNTTMVRDSHKDVHIDGLFKKSLRENKRIKHMDQHGNRFEDIISDKDDLRAFNKTYAWKDLGIDAEGETQAVVFDSTIKQDRHPQMFKEYKEGNVDNHSVGMYYVSIKMALDSKEDEAKEAKAEYDKHIDKILNKKEVEKDGFFYAVYEAKIKEGSAVVDGSNAITPTLEPKAIVTQVEEIPAVDKTLEAIKLFINT